MKIEMKKCLFVGTENAHARFFEKAQELGSFEFIALSKQKVEELPKGLEDTKQALKVLRRFPHQKGPDRSLENGHRIVDQILILKREIENLEEDLKIISAEIIKNEPLGDFDLSDVRRIRDEGKKHVGFYFIRHGRILKEEIPEGLIYVSFDNDLDYYMYIGNQPFYHSLFTEISVREALSDLHRKKKAMEETLHKRHDELKKLAIYRDFLSDLFFHEMNQLHLDWAKGKIETYLEDKLFAIEAWVPSNQLDAIEKLTDEFPIYATMIDPEVGEVIPTYLENKGAARIGQDLVEGYDQPSSTDKDPSPWVIWSFAIFFGMIISDAGYGLLFLLTALLLWFKFPDLQGVKRRMLKLFTLLSGATVIWGVLIGSYFSIIFAPASFLNRSSMLFNIAKYKIEYHLLRHDETFHSWVHEYPSVESATSVLEVLETGATPKAGGVVYPLMDEIYDNLLLEIAIIVGIVHLTFSFLRNLYRSYAGIGWILAMWGGYLFFPKILDIPTFINYFNWMSFTTSTSVGEIVFFSGLVLAIVLGIVQGGLSAGVTGLFKLIEVFADVLSYLRLYALGLASVIMAKTFNEIGIGIGGYMFGWIIILIGHSVNISLSIMAGVIHGLRLNFLEWFHHSFEGGGKRFNPLRLLIRE